MIDPENRTAPTRQHGLLIVHTDLAYKNYIKWGSMICPTCARLCYVSLVARARIVNSLRMYHFQCCPLTSTRRSGPPNATKTSRSRRCT